MEPIPSHPSMCAIPPRRLNTKLRPPRLARTRSSTVSSEGFRLKMRYPLLSTDSAERSFSNFPWNLRSKPKNFSTSVWKKTSASRSKKSMTPLLEIRNVHATAGEKEILCGVDLTINEGEVHAVMGPNASGKSTLANILVGREGYTVTAGQVRYQGADLLSMRPEDRARAGIFLAFQYPIEIPGITISYFLKAALNAIRKHRGLEELDAIDFLALIKEKMQSLGNGSELSDPPGQRGVLWW